MSVRYVMSKEDMASMTLRQIAREKERIEQGEYVLREYKFMIASMSFTDGLEIVRNIKDKLKLRELELQILENGRRN